MTFVISNHIHPPCAAQTDCPYHPPSFYDICNFEPHPPCAARTGCPCHPGSLWARRLGMWRPAPLREGSRKQVLSVVDTGIWHPHFKGTRTISKAAASSFDAQSTELAFITHTILSRTEHWAAAQRTDQPCLKHARNLLGTIHQMRQAWETTVNIVHDAMARVDWTKKNTTMHDRIWITSSNKRRTCTVHTHAFSQPCPLQWKVFTVVWPLIYHTITVTLHLLRSPVRSQGSFNYHTITVTLHLLRSPVRSQGWGPRSWIGWIEQPLQRTFSRLIWWAWYNV